MLSVKNIKVAYDGIVAVYDASFDVHEGEAVTIVGSNGAGKTTILKAIVGLESPMAGSIEFLGQSLVGLPSHEIVTKGIAYVPEGRRLFGLLTVMDNLWMGAISRKASMKEIQDDLDEIYTIFPILAERRNQKAGTLSGGEQQMLAIARGLMFKPKLLMLDEPSLGLMPKFVSTVFEVLKKIKKGKKTSILLVEQKVNEALTLADRGYVLQTGKMVTEGRGEDLLKEDMIKKAYLGL